MPRAAGAFICAHVASGQRGDQEDRPGQQAEARPHDGQPGPGAHLSV